MPITSEAALEALKRIVGTWTTEATHPAFPDLVVHGTAFFEWLKGERFLIQRTVTDHPDFPAAISIIGFTDQDRAHKVDSSNSAMASEPQLCMHYYDSRGVFRVYEVGIDAESWRCLRNAAGFSQRFTGTFAEGGDTILGRWQVCQDDGHWHDDLQITYRRQG